MPFFKQLHGFHRHAAGQGITYERETVHQSLPGGIPAESFINPVVSRGHRLACAAPGKGFAWRQVFQKQPPCRIPHHRLQCFLHVPRKYRPTKQHTRKTQSATMAIHTPTAIRFI